MAKALVVEPVGASGYNAVFKVSAILFFEDLLYSHCYHWHWQQKVNFLFCSTPYHWDDCLLCR